MAFLSNKRKTEEILSIAKEHGREFTLKTPGELAALDSGRNVVEVEEWGFSVFYGRYYGEWCLVGIGPVLGLERITKAKWNRIARQGGEWTPLSRYSKPRSLSHKSEIGAAVWCIPESDPSGVVILGKVLAVDHNERPVEVDVGEADLPPEPHRWLVAARQDAALECIAQGRNVFRSYLSFRTSLFHMDKRIKRDSRACLKRGSVANSTDHLEADSSPVSMAASPDVAALARRKRLDTFQACKAAGMSDEDARAVAKEAHDALLTVSSV